MGWDVVEIGLKHDLPFEDPMATAKAVAQRLNMQYFGKFLPKN